MGTHSSELEELLAHGSWVRALARSLVRDAASADDLVQQACVAALERPPQGHSAPRRWFAAVLRNLARRDRRAEERRTARERFAAARGPETPADDLGETLELSKQLADAVGRLEEPYRSAIFRRYYEGLAPARIAELDGLPLKTVKTRLARGLEQLRERLDSEHRGDRGTWVSACAPLLRGSTTPLALGGLVMNVKLACAIAGLLLVGAWVVLRVGQPELPRPSAALEHGPARDPVALEAPQPATESTPEEARRSAAPGRESGPVPVAGVAAPGREIPGRVVDPMGLGVGDVRLLFATPAEAQAARRSGTSTVTCATSGSDGRFTIQPPAHGCVLLGERVGFVTLLGADVWSAGLQKELLLVVAPAIDVAGVVVDEKGQPIAGADVRISGGERVRRELGLASDSAVDVPWIARSDEHGQFTFERAPGAASADLTAFHPRYTSASIAMPELPRSDLRIVLAARASTVIAGEVVEPNGSPVEDALVGMGQMATRTDRNGRFELELGGEMISIGGGSFDSTRSKYLGAVKLGRLPARMEEPPTGWPGFVTLVIGGEPLTLRGKVLDPQGKALAGIAVRATNEHRFGTVLSKIGNTAWARSFESLVRGGEEFESSVRSDGQGEFELRGLLDEEYVLLAFEPRTMCLAQSEPVHAGRRDVELRFTPPAGVEHVAGRVLSMRGEPLAGASVFPGRPGIGDEAQPIFGTRQVTDAEGRFDFGEIAIDGLELQLTGEGLQNVLNWKPPAGARLSELELRTSRRCHLQVDLGDRKDLADTLVVLDEHGAELELWIHMGNMGMCGMWQPIRDGKSDVVAVPENAAAVVLKKNGVEVQRRPVALRPGALETLRF